MQNFSRTSNYNFKNTFLIANGILLLLIAIFLRPFAIVNAGERGVVMNFGKVQNRILDEGIHPIMPIVTSVKKLSVRVQKNSLKADAASHDLQKLTTELAVNWHIDPTRVNKVFQQIGAEEQIIDGIIYPAVSEVLKAATSKKQRKKS